jgi:hypothetical protein
MTSIVDTDINNYTIEQLVDLLGLPNDYTSDDIDRSVNEIPSLDKTTNDFIQLVSDILKEDLKTEDDLPDEIINNTNSVPVVSEGITPTYQSPYSVGTINPTTVNTIESIVCLDSRFSEFVNGGTPSYNSDYTVNLSEKLHNVISIGISNIYIPTTWYIIDDDIGNNIFKFNNVSYTIPSGNYNINTLVTSLNEITNGVILWEIDEIKNKIVISDIQLNTNLTFVFYSESEFIGNSSYINAGRIIGWHQDSVVLEYNPNISRKYILPYSPSLNGTKHLILVLDDFNKNRHNGGLVGIDVTKTKIDLPEYVDQTVPPLNTNPSVIYARDQPIGLTIRQLYTINEIALNSNVTSKELSPTPTDVITIIPVYPNLRPAPLVLNGGDITSGIREYFGPVSISKLRLKILDDTGTPVNLRGEDWVVTLVIRRLYQY